jgi:hypothetical protein
MKNERSCGWISVAWAVLAAVVAAGLAPAATLDPETRVRIGGDPAFARLGIALAPAGDGNDDGVGNALVGTGFCGLSPEEVEGAFFVFLGGKPAACENGVDDDGDLAVDAGDNGCASSASGSGAGDVVARDSAEAEIASGSFLGQVVASFAARMTIRGGNVSGIVVRDASRMDRVETGFHFPLDDIASLSRKLTGALACDSAISLAVLARRRRSCLQPGHAVRYPSQP